MGTWWSYSFANDSFYDLLSDLLSIDIVGRSVDILSDYKDKWTLDNIPKVANIEDYNVVRENLRKAIKECGDCPNLKSDCSITRAEIATVIMGIKSNLYIPNDDVIKALIIAKEILELNVFTDWKNPKRRKKHLLEEINLMKNYLEI
jgi:hypothetical protein